MGWISMDDERPPAGATVVLWDSMFQKSEVLTVDRPKEIDPDYTHWMHMPPPEPYVDGIG